MMIHQCALNLLFVLQEIAVYECSCSTPNMQMSKLASNVFPWTVQNTPKSWRPVLRALFY